LPCSPPRSPFDPCSLSGLVHFGCARLATALVPLPPGGGSDAWRGGAMKVDNSWDLPLDASHYFLLEATSGGGVVGGRLTSLERVPCFAQWRKTKHQGLGHIRLGASCSQSLCLSLPPNQAPRLGWRWLSGARTPGSGAEGLPVTCFPPNVARRRWHGHWHGRACVPPPGTPAMVYATSELWGDMLKDLKPVDVGGRA